MARDIAIAAIAAFLGVGYSLVTIAEVFLAPRMLTDSQWKMVGWIAALVFLLQFATGYRFMGLALWVMLTEIHIFTGISSINAKKNALLYQERDNFSWLWFMGVVLIIVSWIFLYKVLWA